MTILTPLIAQALGRSPYDEEVWHFAGLPTPGETTQRYQQQYDQRGRPVNPSTRSTNRDIIRAHNEVMLAIGVVEPEASWQEALAKQESVRRHRIAETAIAKRLLFINGVVEKCVVWGVSGMRQRIMIYKDFAGHPLPWAFQAKGGGESFTSYMLAGLPSYITSTLYEYIYLPEFFNNRAMDYFITYIRLHLEIFSFLQRMGISPTDTLLPTWRFFLPGTSISPLPIPPPPSSLAPLGLLGWVGTFTVGLVPVAGFYLFKRYSLQFTDMLKYIFHEIVPAPVNRRKRARSPLRDVTSRYHPDDSDPMVPPGFENIPPAEHPPGGDSSNPATNHHEDPTTLTSDDHPGPSEAFPVGTVRRQSSAASRRADEDEFASDEEENDMVRAAIISIEVGPAEASTSGGNNDVLGEIRPHMEDKNGAGDADHEPVYRENTFTLLPSYFGASILGLAAFRLVSTPWEGLTMSVLTRSYARRVGYATGGMNRLSFGGQFGPWVRWVNTTWLELLLFEGVGATSILLSWILYKSKISEEEWEEMEKKNRIDEARIQE